MGVDSHLQPGDSNSRERRRFCPEPNGTNPALLITRRLNLSRT